MLVYNSIFVESTYSKARAPQPHEILVKSETVTYTTDPVATLRVHSTDIRKVKLLLCYVYKFSSQYMLLRKQNVSKHYVIIWFELSIEYNRLSWPK